MGGMVVQRSAPGRRTRRSEREWRALVKGYARGDETRRAFCARHGVALSTFAWWQRRVRDDAHGVTSTTARDASDAGALFVELTSATPPMATPSASAWDVELTLGAGVVLRVRRGASPC